MELLKGKRGVIMGVANEHSIALGIAKTLVEHGASIGYSYLPGEEGRDRMEKRVRRAVDPLNPAFVLPCDVSKDADVEKFFSEVGEHFNQIDFLVHSVAFAPLEDLRCPSIESSRQGFLKAMDISVYSFMTTARAASSLMTQGGSIVTLTYFGGERVVPGYNMMGICKAALEAALRYAAYDLGSKGIRVNGLSAGPVRTLAASAIGDFKKVLEINATIAPLQRNITANEVGKAALFLLSDLGSATTGENLHVDSGYHIMGSPMHALGKFAEMAK
jgi:enoyl-[acyl-carrier protein] reductase I